MFQIVRKGEKMNYYERRFYEDFHKMVKIQEKILIQLQKLNEPVVEDAAIPMILTEEDLETNEQRRNK